MPNQRCINGICGHAHGHPLCDWGALDQEDPNESERTEPNDD
jgi:hypothetical protein